MTNVTVITTLPCIEDDMIRPFDTPRLIIRPLSHPADLEAYRAIRSQPAAMTSSRTGQPDATLGETEAKLRRLHPPYRDSHAYFGIFLKGPADGTEGELIGDGGVHEFAGTETGWPEFGYKFKWQHWGHGYATEFAKAFMHFWWGLPRCERRVRVAASSLVGSPGELSGGQMPRVPEYICAWTKVDNKPSQRVLQKAGFESFEGLDNGLIDWWSTNADLVGASVLLQ